MELGIFYRIFGGDIDVDDIDFTGYIAIGLSHSFSIIMGCIQFCIVRQLALLTYN